MLLTRDPVGEKTVYWTRTADGAIVTAPRLRDLRRYSGGVDPAALRDYLTCAFVPGRQTMHAGIYELRPGQSVDTQNGTLTDGPEFPEGAWSPDDPLSTHAARLRPLLEEAVRRRLPCDPYEPVGVYLSGGLDSSLVTALTKAFHRGPVHTFAIHFGPDHPNELRFSQMVADHCQTIHHVLELPAQTILKYLPESIAALDDPIGDPLTTPNLLLGKAAKAAGLRTILNGEGGDPVFGGPKNLPMLLHALYDPHGAEDVRSAYFRSYQKCYDDLPALLTPEMTRALAGRKPQETLLDPFLRDDLSPMKSYLNRLMLLNVRLKGADHILTKVNNLTTHCGLIGKSPLFDPQIVAAGFAIPPAYKLDGAREKAVLKAAVADLLPEPILTRPKSGMMVPVQKWFRDEMRRFARSQLLSRRARIRPLLDQGILRHWLDYGPMPFPRHGVKIWLALTLELWLRENG